MLYIILYVVFIVLAAKNIFFFYEFGLLKMYIILFDMIFVRAMFKTTIICKNMFKYKEIKLNK